MDSKKLTPEESLSIINRAISNFRTNYQESAGIFLLWGWVLTFASISSFIILRLLNYKEAHDLMGILSLGNWVFFILTGFIIQLPMLRKIKREKKEYGHLDTYINRLWQVTIVTFFVATFICIKLEIDPPKIMLLIAGMATTTTGLLIRFRPVIIGGAAFFAFSIAAAFVTNEYIALLTGAAIVCGYLIPGYALKAADAKTANSNS